MPENDWGFIIMVEIKIGGVFYEQIQKNNRT